MPPAIGSVTMPGPAPTSLSTLARRAVSARLESALRQPRQGGKALPRHGFRRLREHRAMIVVDDDDAAAAQLAGGAIDRHHARRATS